MAKQRRRRLQRCYWAIAALFTLTALIVAWGLVLIPRKSKWLGMVVPVRAEDDATGELGPKTDELRLALTASDEA